MEYGKHCRCGKCGRFVSCDGAACSQEKDGRPHNEGIGPDGRLFHSATPCQDCYNSYLDYKADLRAM